MDANPKCPMCATAMRPLFQSFFCPHDCDRKKPEELPDVCCGTAMAAFHGLLEGKHCWTCGKVKWADGDQSRQWVSIP